MRKKSYSEETFLQPSLGVTTWNALNEDAPVRRFVLEGVRLPVHFLFCWLPPCRQLLDMKIFVDTDSDIRLVRRLRRDITERGRDIEGVIKQYNKFVKPAFEQYIEPTMRLADIVVPRGALKKKEQVLVINLFIVVNIALFNKPLLILS